MDIKDSLTNGKGLSNKKNDFIDKSDINKSILEDLDIEINLIENLKKNLKKFYRFYILEKTSKRRNYLTFDLEKIIDSAFFAMYSKNLGNSEWMAHCATSLRSLLYVFYEERDRFFNLCEEYFKKNKLNLKSIPIKKDLIKKIWVYISFFSALVHYDFNSIKEKMIYIFRDLNIDNNDELNYEEFILIVKNFLIKLNNFFDMQQNETA